MIAGQPFLTRSLACQIDRSGRFPVLRFKDKDSYANNKTKEYDEIASKYLSYALYPLIFGYAVYSLLYENHKSWYSWVLGTLTGCVYTFGEPAVLSECFSAMAALFCV